MKKFFKNLLTVLFGIAPAFAGYCVYWNITSIIKNIKMINTSTGWTAITCFVLLLLYAILTISFLYQLGVVEVNSKSWIAYKRAKAEDNNDSSSEESETSDEAANT